VLSARPRDPSAILVTVYGAAATGWSYDPATNRIVFADGAIPAPGSKIAATYEPVCQ
jgi:hypothetical protein